MRLLSPLATVAALALCAAAFTACGDDDDETSAGPASQQLAPVKDYLLAHTTRLTAATGRLADQAVSYQRLVEAAGGERQALAERRDEVAGLVTAMQKTWREANPAYEEMEGIVAGVPSLAEYDTILDAGSDASDPESAVPFDVKTLAGRTLKQPGNFFFLTETSLWGTDDRFVARGVRPDLDGDGKVEFGEALPAVDTLVPFTRDMAEQARELEASAKEFEPTESDVFTALVVMVPTMSEYFEQWKNSRQIAGSKATEAGFVGASRTSDISSILGGLVEVYKSVEPTIAKDSAARARQTGGDLRGLYDFAEDIRAREAAGERFEPEQAETLGAEAQDRAEAIAGQVSQVAGRLGIEIDA